MSGFMPIEGRWLPATVTPALLWRAGIRQTVPAPWCNYAVKVQARSAGQGCKPSGEWALGADMNVWPSNCRFRQGGPFMRKSLCAAVIGMGLLAETAVPVIAATTHHKSTKNRNSTRNRSGRRRARNVGVGAAGGAAAGAIVGRGRGAGAGAVIGGTAGALTPTRRR